LSTRQKVRVLGTPAAHDEYRFSRGSDQQQRAAFPVRLYQYRNLKLLSPSINHTVRPPAGLIPAAPRNRHFHEACLVANVKQSTNISLSPTREGGRNQSSTAAPLSFFSTFRSMYYHSSRATSAPPRPADTNYFPLTSGSQPVNQLLLVRSGQSSQQWADNITPRSCFSFLRLRLTYSRIIPPRFTSGVPGRADGAQAGGGVAVAAARDGARHVRGRGRHGQGRGLHSFTS
jgi:hypothetical protein